MHASIKTLVEMVPRSILRHASASTCIETASRSAQKSGNGGRVVQAESNLTTLL